jgi:Plasmid stability protein
MAAITIRQLDDRLKARLRMQAARNGHSMEEEARNILKAGLAPETAEKSDLARAIRRHIDLWEVSTWRFRHVSPSVNLQACKSDCT